MLVPRRLVARQDTPVQLPGEPSPAPDSGQFMGCPFRSVRETTAGNFAPKHVHAAPMFYVPDFF